MKHIAAILLAFLASVATAKYSRLDVDVSKLPGEKGVLARLVRSRVYERTPPSPSGKVFRVEFTIDGSLSNETAVVHVADGCAKVHGGRFRALVFGAGCLLRSLRYGAKSFDMPCGEFVFRPAKPIREVYLARHFNTWYHRA